MAQAHVKPLSHPGPHLAGQWGSLGIIMKHGGWRKRMGPRKFILQLIFTSSFNLSLRSFVKLLCCGSFPAKSSLGRWKAALSRGSVGRKCCWHEPEMQGPPGQLPGHAGVHPQHSSGGPEISRIASVVVALLPIWPGCLAWLPRKRWGQLWQPHHSG